MKLGGYKIIDFEGYTFTLNTAKAVPGIHERIETSRKPLLICGLKVGTDEYRPVFGEATGGSPYVIKLSTIIISIAKDDKVTITANA